MAIGFDVATGSAADLASGANHSHTATANAKAVVVGVIEGTSASDLVTNVTYGGLALTRIRRDSESTEPGSTYLYWRDNIATGTQNVVVTHTGTVQIGVATMTAATNFGIQLDSSATGTSASVANPSWTHTAVRTNTFGFLCIHSGLTTMTTTPGANWTLIAAVDRGAFGQGSARGTSIFATTTLAPVWTAATADDFVGSSAAFYEVPGSDEVHTTPLMAPGRHA